MKIYRQSEAFAATKMLKSDATYTERTDEMMYSFLLKELFSSVYILAKRSSWTFKFNKQECEIISQRTGELSPAWAWTVQLQLSKPAWQIHRGMKMKENKE